MTLPLATLALTLASAGMKIFRGENALVALFERPLDLLAGHTDSDSLEKLGRRLANWLDGNGPPDNEDIEKAITRSAVSADLFCLEESITRGLGGAGLIHRIGKHLQPIDHPTLTGVLSQASESAIREAIAECKTLLADLDRGVFVRRGIDPFALVSPEPTSTLGAALAAQAFIAINREGMPDRVRLVYERRWFGYLCLAFHDVLKTDQRVFNTFVTMQAALGFLRLEHVIREEVALARSEAVEHHAELIRTLAELRSMFRYDSDDGRSATPQRVIAWSGRPAPIAHFVGRHRELQALNAGVLLSAAPIVVVSAIGGQGKTTLVAQWLFDYEKANTGHFDRVCYFSAYRFGVEYIGFLEFAVESLAPNGAPPNTRTDVLSRLLLDLLRQRRTLLIVDGIERWLVGGQNPVTAPWSDENREESPAARGFGHLLQQFASTRNGSKLVMTTRAVPRALDGIAPGTVINVSASGHGGLSGLDERAGVLLFNRLGTLGSNDEKARCTKELDGHPLAMRLLASILQTRRKPLTARSDVYALLAERDARLAAILSQAQALCGNDARILQAAAICPEDAPVDAIVYALDGEADSERIRVAIDQLEDWGLMSLSGRRRHLVQLHPLVRSHFASTLTDARPMHRRCAQFFASLAISPRPRSLARVAPRIWAIEHAAAAGDYDLVIELLSERPLVAGSSKSEVGALTLSDWFPKLGQSGFELEWTRKLVDKAPVAHKRLLLTSMVVAAQRCGMTDTAQRLIAEALDLEG
jgi:hypothetical protein